ncbi:MAG TPA: carbohydrate-binding protein [Cytophagales bacterium]|nr:carbohydrate-binding protein [Cytophagales bacterium]
MNKLIRLSLMAFILLFSISLSFAQKPGKRGLGTTKSFAKNLRDQLNSSPSSNQRTLSKSVKVSVSDKESFSLKVNVNKSENSSHQYLVGKVENKESGSFIIKINGNKLEGSIVLKKEKKAFKYYSDAKGNAFVEPADINSILCIDYTKAAGPSASTSEAPVSSAAMPDLQSFPGARGCVMLDYDGHYVSGTYWNNGNPINAAPSGMSDAAIIESWEIVSEDFRPFNVNVTTNEAVFNSYPKNMRMRCIITPTNTAAPGAGGVAYIGSFNWNDDTPCWVFMLGAKSSAEAASHEIGHTFDLHHDGRTNPNEGYFAGHGDWAPIMGVGYYEPISQWSKGEYNYANQFQDDLAIIAGTKFNVGYRNDDHSNSVSGATALARNNTSVSGRGIIERTSDQDFFSFASGSGTVNLNVNTVSRHGDLDILVRLHNSSGGVIGTYNPAGLNASFSANVSAGTYYVSVDGTGAGNPATNGYSDYASLGTFTISGTAPVPSVAGVAIMYKDCNFSANAVGLQVGDYNLSQLISRGISNDDISSLRVTSGYEVIAYQHDNFGGASFTFTADDACLVDNGINDYISSLRVRARATSFSTTIQAESYSAMAGVQTENTTDAGGGTNVGWIDNGDWMAYNNITIPSSGAYKVEYRVASGTSGGTLSLDVNAGATVLGTLGVPGTGGWQNWTTISHTVNINAGTYNFGIFAQAGGWNLNWWRITSLNTGARIASSEDNTEPSLTTIDLYPNPSFGKLNFSSAHDLSGAQVKIFDRMGVEAISTSFNANGLDVSVLKPGLYTITIIKAGKRITSRFIKN